MVIADNKWTENITTTTNSSQNQQQQHQHQWLKKRPSSYFQRHAYRNLESLRTKNCLQILCIITEILIMNFQENLQLEILKQGGGGGVGSTTLKKNPKIHTFWRAQASLTVSLLARLFKKANNYGRPVREWYV